jgi:outer membrane protein insertion porin family
MIPDASWNRIAPEPNLPPMNASPSSRWFAWCALNVLLLATPARSAEKKVIKVEVEVSGVPVDAARIRALMSLREGEVFTEEKTEDDIKSIYQSSLVDDLDISAEEKAEGVIVKVTASGRGVLGEISFEGNQALDAGLLKSLVKLQTGEIISEASLSGAVMSILERYQALGFADVQLTYDFKPMPDKKDAVRVAFKIQENEKTLIHAIRLEGLKAMEQGKLLAMLELKPVGAPVPKGQTAGIFSDLAFLSDFKTIEKTLQDEGYVYAKVIEVRREPVKPGHIDVVFVIHEGGRFKIAAVDVADNKVFAREVLLQGLSLQAGQWYSVSRLRNDQQRIDDYYGSRGYVDARTEHEISEVGPLQVKILHRVAEGEIAVFGQIEVGYYEGEEKDFIARHFKLVPGQPIDTTLVRRCREELQATGRFADVETRITPTDRPGVKDLYVAPMPKPLGKELMDADLGKLLKGLQGPP